MDVPVSVSPPRRTKKWVVAGIVAALAIAGGVIWGVSTQEKIVEPARSASACIFNGALPTAKDMLALQSNRDGSAAGAVEVLAGYIQFSTQMPVVDASQYVEVADALTSPDLGQELVINTEASRNFDYVAVVALEGTSYLIEDFVEGKAARISISLPFNATNGETATLAGTYFLTYDAAGWVIQSQENNRAANVIKDTGQLLVGTC